jgi:predicted O-methyltransferase YrrM
MMSINDFLYLNSAYNMGEGHSGQVSEQTDTLKELVSNPSIKNVLEIGFNSGHSADTFLSSNPNIKLVSFDIGTERNVILGKTYVDRKHSFRHCLIIGDSTKTVPEFVKEHPDLKFDLIFIDGGHTYDIATKDIMNCKELAHADTIVAMDDVVHDSNMEYCTGPTKAWTDAASKNIVAITDTIKFQENRGMSWGKYVLS